MPHERKTAAGNHEAQGVNCPEGRSRFDRSKGQTNEAMETESQTEGNPQVDAWKSLSLAYQPKSRQNLIALTPLTHGAPSSGRGLFG